MNRKWEWKSNLTCSFGLLSSFKHIFQIVCECRSFLSCFLISQVLSCVSRSRSVSVFRLILRWMLFWNALPGDRGSVCALTRRKRGHVGPRPPPEPRVSTEPHGDVHPSERGVHQHMIMHHITAYIYISLQCINDAKHPWMQRLLATQAQYHVQLCINIKVENTLTKLTLSG